MEEEYNYVPKKINNTCCKICGISSFAHSHPAMSKPKDFIMAEEETKVPQKSREEVALEEVRELREHLRFMWRWISRLNGDKPHDRPESEWKTYVNVLVNYPSAPYETGDWYEDDETSPALSFVNPEK